MKLTIKGNSFTITGELSAGTPSASGKTLVLASTRGNMKTDQQHSGQNVVVGLNMYIPVAKAAPANA